MNPQERNGNGKEGKLIQPRLSSWCRRQRFVCDKTFPLLHSLVDPSSVTTQLCISESLWLFDSSWQTVECETWLSRWNTTRSRVGGDNDGLILYLCLWMGRWLVRLFSHCPLWHLKSSWDTLARIKRFLIPGQGRQNDGEDGKSLSQSIRVNPYESKCRIDKKGASSLFHLYRWKSRGGEQLTEKNSSWRATPLLLSLIRLFMLSYMSIVCPQGSKTCWFEKHIAVSLGLKRKTLLSPIRYLLLAVAVWISFERTSIFRAHLLFKLLGSSTISTFIYG